MAYQKLNDKGYTLLEMLVATSIFVIVAMASLAIYQATLKAGRETVALTRIQQDAQLIMQVLAKKIRTSQVDYSYANYSPAIVNPVEELALIDQVGDGYVFKKNNGALSVSVNGGVFKDIAAANVVINNLQFFINPTTNPFISLDTPPISYPYVTIAMTISSEQGLETAGMTVQETVPQRSGVAVP